MMTIDIFPWNDNFNTGLSKVDEQHQRLVHLLNQLASHVAYQADLPGLNVIFDELADYANYHFQTEEAIWHRYLLADRLESTHKYVHNEFIATILRLRNEQHLKPVDSVIEDILAFLARWLASHFLEDDRYMALVVLAMQSGLAPDQAKDQARRQLSGTMRVLIDIILATYGSLATNTLRLMKEIADHKRAEQELRIAHLSLKESIEHIQALIDTSLDAIISMDQHGLVVGWNRQAERIFGYTEEQALARALSELIVPPAFRERHQQGLARFLQTGSATQIGRRVEILAMRADGTEFPAELTLSVSKRQGKPLFSAYVRDISERKAAEAEIENLAFFDPLTKLPNRRLLIDRLQQVLVSSARHDNVGALLLIDLDNFKSLNDTLGHEVGDQLLQQVARRLAESVRQDDTVARLGGDEFVVMLQHLSENTQDAAFQTEAAAQKILASLNLPYVLGGHDYRNTPSIGIVLLGGHQTSVDEVLKRADIAMYQAKRSGRNLIRFFDPDMQAAVESRSALEGGMLQALKASEFILFYQIQVDEQGNVVGAEVLLRWQHPVRGLMTPVEFISIAEETGLIVLIGEWVLETVCELLKAWEEDPKRQHLQLAVNVSAAQFHQPDFVEQFSGIITRSGINGGRLKLELTESLVLTNLADTIVKMQALKGRGVTFAMDDFGTGYSSLASLKKLPLDQLKIDQSFVRDICDDPDDATIVQTIIAMAHNLGMEVIAEGVEAKNQLDLLVQQGCTRFQGFHFGKPMALADFERMLSTAVPD